MEKTENKCAYEVLMIQFGKDTEDAYNIAVAKRNTWAGESASMSVPIKKPSKF